MGRYWVFSKFSGDLKHPIPWRPGFLRLSQHWPLRKVVVVSLSESAPALWSAALIHQELGDIVALLH